MVVQPAKKKFSVAGKPFGNRADIDGDVRIVLAPDGAWWNATRLAAATPLPDLSIKGITTRLELAALRWGDIAAAGYFGNHWPWER